MLTISFLCNLRTNPSKFHYHLFLPKIPNFTLISSSSSSMASAKVVVEYAKSNRSSCKKCEKTIVKDALRLGSVTRDSRGFDMTKWHHLRCFPNISESVDSTDAIEGFSLLKIMDQESLQNMLDGNDQSTEEVEQGGADENETKEKNPKKGKPAKVVAEYAKSSRSSCKKCEKTIVKDTLRLGSVTRDRGFDMTKWHHLRCFPNISESVGSTDAIEGFSLLKSNDQESLKKMLDGSDLSPEEVQQGGADENETEEKNPKKEKASAKVAVEYAKSNRSSCKKCENTIVKDALRLGSVTRDSRGFDMTKWHHLRCFPNILELVDSPDAIEGYSLLKSKDQESLKKMLDGSDQSPEEVEVQQGGADENETEERKSKKAKLSIPQEEAKLEMAFSRSDIRDKYKDAELSPKWKAFQTIIFLEQDEGLNDSKKIAAFDFDGCLANTSVKRVGPDAWSLMYPSIPDKLQSLYKDGYKLVIFTNEANIERWKNKRQVAVDSKVGRLDNFIKHVKVPIQVFIACGVASKSSGQEEDVFRKPKPGMWHIMEKHFNSGIAIDMDQSFYVGDAAGRDNDHSDADIKFAQAVGLKFHLPEEYFL